MRDSPEFEDWRFLTTEALQHELATVLSLLTDAHVHAGGLDQAIVAARRRLEHALALARRLHDVAVEIAAANNLAQAHAAAGAVERALPLAQAALHNLADLLRASGRDDDAMVHLKQAVTLLADMTSRRDPKVEVWKLAEW